MKDIKVISASSCKNCEILYEVVKKLVEKKGIDAKVEKVVDMKEVLKFGVMTTPLLVVNGKLKHAGTPLPSPEEIEKLITED